MPLNKGKLEKLRRVVKLHVNWFVAAILGEDALTESERAELEKFKKLPKQSLGLVEKGFILGRLKAIFKKKEWKSLSWEDFLELIQRQKLSPLEKLVLQQAKLSAAQHIKGLTDDIAAGVFDQLARATNQAISEASIKQIIKDEVALAVLEKKSYKDLASNLASSTKAAYGRKWEQVARTELHSVKTHGLAQAIINKVDVYKNSQGIASDVSIVPKPGTCPDCAEHYLDASGSPLVFPLSQLMGAGSNADPGVSHKKKKNVHLFWKTTLPPLHPNCRCELVFIPPGYTWVGVKLTLTDPGKIRKAIGDSALSAVVKPAGPKSAQVAPKMPATVPGIKAPQQSTAGGGISAGPANPNVRYEPKSQSPERPPGTIGETEKEWKVIPGAGKGKDLTPEQEVAKQQEETASAIEWGSQPRDHRETLDHLKNGELTNIHRLSGDEAGQSGLAIRANAAGNGRVLLKQGTKKLEAFGPGKFMLAGDTTTVPGTQPHRTQAYYRMNTQFGLADHVSPTTLRNHEGQLHSCTSWKEGFSPVRSALYAGASSSGNLSPIASTVDIKQKMGSKNVVRDLLARAPEGKRDDVHNKLSEQAVMQIVGNAGDAGHQNMLVNKDFSDVSFIDSSANFGHGMHGISSEIHRDIHNNGMKLKVSNNLLTQFKNTSYGDMKKSHGDKLGRESAQSFLRMRYTQHLMETEGHLDYNKFKAVMIDPTGEDTPRPGVWGKNIGEEVKNFQTAQDKGELPTDHFNSFVKDYVSKASAEGHVDNASVTSILKDHSVEDLTMNGKQFLDKYVLPHATGKASPTTSTHLGDTRVVAKSLFLKDPDRAWS
jgi:hypothetical protein